ncbi:MAG: hypothetical protein K0S11_356 [Gammaproteobacteria bacterium]|jgi:hypothetical protein|nr:hypothetical protein [Gammaproteobacteria bacterium]
MATHNRSFESYTLLSLNPENTHPTPPQSPAKKGNSRQRWFSWNTLFKGTAIILLAGGAIAVGFGIASALWPVSIPVAIFVALAATSVWLIASYKTIYNTMAKWGSALAGDDTQLDKAETLLKDINKLNKKVNKELVALNEQEQKNARFLELNQELAKHDEQTAAQLAKLYLESAKQQNRKYRDFHKIVKFIRQVDPKLANKLQGIYSHDNSLRKQETFVKAQHCYQILAHKNKHLAKQMAELYIDHQQQENEINHQFQKLRAKIHKHHPKLADKLTKLTQETDLENGKYQTPAKGYFKAFPCQVKRTWTHSLLKEIKTKQATAEKLLKNVEVYDEINQKRQNKYQVELTMSRETVNGFYPQLRTLTNLYQDFKSKLKDFTHPIKESLNHFTKTIKSHSPFKTRSTQKRLTQQPTLSKQVVQREATNPEIELDPTVSHAETLINHGLFATANEPGEAGQGQEKLAKNISLDAVSKMAVSS